MGSSIVKQWAATFGPRKSQVCILGLSGAGKTALLYKLHLGKNIPTIPTLGFNIETIKREGLAISMWDVSSKPRLRPLIYHYYERSEVVVFVVDSTQPADYDEVAEAIGEVYARDYMKDVPLLVLANKQDAVEAVPPQQVVEALQRRDALPAGEWNLVGTSVTEGMGLEEAMHWLCETIKRQPPRQPPPPMPH
eukprot:TRINITY_DN735_c1_g1_i1.p2 TRINITY_DN735_c1_g1~~TRINITY_DN735_c1_g1_i1.p2  ORF type:complete len:193 (-),score=13.06 TRINITY_DN735_c1_g1_i1:706-1284(-)